MAKDNTLTQIEIFCSIFGESKYVGPFFKDLMTVDNSEGIEIEYNEAIMRGNEDVTRKSKKFVGFDTLFSTWHIKDYSSYEFVMEFTYMPLLNNGNIYRYENAHRCGRDMTFLVLSQACSGEENFQFIEKYEKNVIRNKKFSYHNTTKYYLIYYLLATDKVNQVVDSQLKEKCQEIGMQVIEVNKANDLHDPFLQMVTAYAQKELGACVLL